jgi:hypothetical protein
LNLALHDPPLYAAFIDDGTGLVSQPWVEWLIINKRDKIDAVDDAVEGNIPTFDADGHLEDSGSSESGVIGRIVALEVADVLIQADIDALEAADILIQADITALQAEDLASEARSYFYANNL